jgi:hypothetical protein
MASASCPARYGATCMVTDAGLAWLARRAMVKAGELGFARVEAAAAIRNFGLRVSAVGREVEGVANFSGDTRVLPRRL